MSYSQHPADFGTFSFLSLTNSQPMFNTTGAKQ
jgi:hypothetical protein